MTSRDPKKSWAFTLNNYTEEEEKQLKDLECNYIVYGHEVGQEGTPHLQGHIVFKTAKRLSGLKKINERIHWSETIDEEASANYCMKDKNYFTKDNRKQGKRSDLTEAIETLRAKGMQQVKTDHPETYVRFYRGLEQLSMDDSIRNFKPYVEWIFGSTGTGKTRYVYERETDLWISGRDLRFWNGYQNQEATLFDDFRGDFCTFHELLRILDRYPMTVDVKGGYRNLNSKRMYITSCYPPTDVYKTREDISQLVRRIDKVTEL